MEAIGRISWNLAKTGVDRARTRLETLLIALAKWMSDIQGVSRFSGWNIRSKSFFSVCSLTSWLSSPLCRKGISGQSCPAVSRHFKRKLAGRKRSRCINIWHVCWKKICVVRDISCCKRTKKNDVAREKGQKAIAVNPNRRDKMHIIAFL